MTLEILESHTSNLSNTGKDLCERALRLRVDGGQPLVLGAGSSQGHQDKQEDKGQLLHLDSFLIVKGGITKNIYPCSLDELTIPDLILTS